MTEFKAPTAQIDLKHRIVMLQQQHPILLENQKVAIPFFMLKELVARIMMQEANAEMATGDPRAVNQPPPTNGQGQP